MPIHARVPRDWSPRVQLVLLLVLHGVQIVFAAVPGRRENQRDAVDGHTDAAAHGAEAVVERDGEADSRGGLRPDKARRGQPRERQSGCWDLRFGGVSPASGNRRACPRRKRCSARCNALAWRLWDVPSFPANKPALNHQPQSYRQLHS